MSDKELSDLIIYLTGEYLDNEELGAVVREVVMSTLHIRKHGLEE
jgi:hypothetical protein